MAKEKKAPNPDRLPLGKFFAWRTSAFTMAACMMIIMGFLTIYCTDTLLMPAGLVGMLLLGSKVLDGVGEMFAGYLIDNTHTRFGKGRPYEFCMVGVWVGMYFLFSCPQSFGMVGKCIWIFVFYTLVMSVFQTLFAAAQTPYMMRAFANKTVYVKLQSYGGIVGMFLSIAFNILFPILVARYTPMENGWSKLLLMVAIPMILIGLIRFFVVKEEVKIEGEVMEKIPFKEVIRTFTKNKYVWILAAMTLISQVLFGLGIGSYYFKYVVGDMGMMGVLSMISIVILPVMFIFPLIIKRTSVITVVIMGCISGIIGYAINFFALGNLPMLLVGGLFTGLSTMAPSYILPIVIVDCAVYNEYIGLPRLESTLGAMNGLGSNVGGGLASALVGGVLTMGGFISGAEAAAQPASAIMAIRSLNSIVPIVLLVLMIVFAKMFDLERKIPKMKEELAARRAAQQAESV